MQDHENDTEPLFTSYKSSSYHYEGNNIVLVPNEEQFPETNDDNDWNSDPTVDDRDRMNRSFSTMDDPQIRKLEKDFTQRLHRAPNLANLSSPSLAHFSNTSNSTCSTQKFVFRYNKS